jgi:hypothetical protein
MIFLISDSKAFNDSLEGEKPFTSSKTALISAVYRHENPESYSML